MMEWDEEKEIEDLKLDLPGREALGSLMVIIVVHYTALLVTLTAHHNYWWQPNVLRLCIRHCVWTRCSWTTASTWRSCGEWGGKGTSHGGLSRGGIQSEAPNDHQQVADRYAKKTSQSRWTDQQNVSYQKFGLGDEDTFLYKVGLVFFFERMSKPILNPTVNMRYSLKLSYDYCQGWHRSCKHQRTLWGQTWIPCRSCMVKVCWMDSPMSF